MSEHDLEKLLGGFAADTLTVEEKQQLYRAALHDQPIAVADHRLVNLRHEFSEARRDADGETYHGIVRYRAVTEPAA